MNNERILSTYLLRLGGWERRIARTRPKSTACPLLSRPSFLLAGSALLVIVLVVIIRVSLLF